MMDGRKGEWAIAFHGVTYPTRENKMRSIMNGRKEGNMLRAGFGQVYQSNICMKMFQQLDKEYMFLLTS